MVPHSISLLQFAFGVLTNNALIQPPLERFVPLITSELLDLYPKTAQFETRFLFDA
jgi:hypothetical protein